MVGAVEGPCHHTNKKVTKPPFPEFLYCSRLAYVFCVGKRCKTELKNKTPLSSEEPIHLPRRRREAGKSAVLVRLHLRHRQTSRQEESVGHENEGTSF